MWLVLAVWPAQLRAEQCESSSDELTVARQSLEATKRVVQAGGQFTAADAAWLAELQNTLGRAQMTVPDPDSPGGVTTVDCSLSVANLNSIPHAAESLRDALQAMIQASELAAPLFDYGSGSVPVYNGWLFDKMCTNYDSASFAELYAVAQAHKLFAVSVNAQTGLVGTSGGAENFEMSARQWVTDTVRTGELEKSVAPQAWPKALQMLASFYTNASEQKAFDKAIADPHSYREGGPEEGVAHIFFPATLQRDSSWFNNKRLESHGLALAAMVEAILAGNTSSEAWGIAEPSDSMLEAVANLTAYFVAIDYASAPSAGNWEETPFAGGLTWDSEAIRLALVDVRNLMFSPKYATNAGMAKVRNRLLHTKHGKLLAQPGALDEAIASGLARVRRTYMAESPGHREMDASLVFVACSPVLLDDDALVSIGKKLELLEALERTLVRRHGMLRYAPFKMQLKDGSVVESPDSYLNLNYNVACDNEGRINLRWKQTLDGFGSKDASDPEVFAARAKLSTADREAEWFMVSDLARAYTRQAMAILEYAQARSVKGTTAVLTTEEKRMLSVAWQGATRNINRAYARVTPAYASVKSNGLVAPDSAIPEAWQYVSAIPNGSQALPGVNTPLTWAQVSLWGASREYAAGLHRLEEWRSGQPAAGAHHGRSVKMDR